MKIGLVLEGGAMRGMYTAAVLDTFLEHNICVDEIVGVSAGALFGVNYLSRQSGRVIRYNKRFNSDKNYMGLRPLIREGNIVSTEYAYSEVPCRLDVFDDETYKASTVPFYAVLTDMDSGKPEYIRISSVFQQMDTLRASGSMPFVSQPVVIDGKQYLDGGISDSIPFRWLSEQGCDKLIVIVTRDRNYRKKPMARGLTKMFYSKYPSFRKALKSRWQMYNSSVDELNKWEKQGRAFVIRPSSPIEIGKMEKNPDKLQAVYNLGKSDTLKQLDNLKEYLSR